MTRSPTTRRIAELALCFAAPLGMGLLVSGAAYDEPRWWHLGPLPRDAAASLALAANTAALTCVCAVSTPGRRACYRIAMFVVGSCVMAAAVAGRSVPTAWLPAHLLLAMAATAVITARALAGRVWGDPLDASGLTLAAVLAALTGPLWLGPALPTVPVWLSDAVLRVNPVVAVSAAADVDLLHTDLFYRLAPIAHWQFDYPGTTASLALFSVAAAVMAGASRARRTVTPAYTAPRGSRT